MIITKNFAVLNFPKTGTSFLRTKMKEYYAGRFTCAENSLKYKFLRKIGSDYFCDIKRMNPTVPYEHRYDQHGCYFQMPESHKYGKIITFVRDPVDWYLSAYYFRGWVRRTNLYTDEQLRKKTEDLQLNEFLEYHRMDMKRSVPYLDFNENIGGLSIHYVWMYTTKPMDVFKMIGQKGVTDDILEYVPENIKGFHFSNLSESSKKIMMQFTSSNKGIQKINFEEIVQPKEGTKRQGKKITEDNKKTIMSFLGKEQIFYIISKKLLENNSK
jgi:hypothetical protein